ncbi:MAG: endonuclease/exonuclease/phosphatase family protein [Candidatus Spechtbacteria bacterium SB0662_bin_43]|uniref:Endonuclease/exonuclease/phosphatase family protein n=1 Tax=Candidatus Spechtbacteria bacterium SB0662_bin_43 TaxID=2604897 RepID=A0A845DAU1_9BACT|nr:endonuclease/exonuclease/phosphatase family protein [Candidatus Spechtbacteria bacterium SB0662_bin_43]
MSTHQSGRRARGSFRWIAEIILSLQMHIIAFLVACALGVMVVLQPVFIPVLLLVLLGVYLLVYATRDLPQAHSDTSSLRIMSINVLRDNTEYELVAQVVQQEHPDIVALVEYTDEWRTGLEKTGVLAEYPFYCHRPFAHGTYDDGIAVYSKEEFAVQEESPDGSFLACKSERFDFIVAHLHNPIVSRESFLQRNEQMDAIARIVQRSEPRPIAVFGDFNTTPYSLEFRSFLKESGLKNAAARQWLPSWTPLVRWWANIGGLPLDHFLHNKRVVVAKIRVGSFVASDHRPIIVDFHIPGQDKEGT